MRYLDRLRTESTLWVLALMLMLIALTGAFLYMVLVSITY
jgi:hypothetical protein